jgi:hypothetical protein
METQRFSFTAARLEGVIPPVSGAIQVYDSITPGLAMRVTKAGARTFVVFRRIHGRPVRMKLGSVGSLSIPDARKAAQQIAGRAAAGVDVVAERAAARARGRTIGNAFTTWLSFAKHRKRSWQDDKRLWELWIEGKPDESRAMTEADNAERQTRRSFPSFARRPLRGRFHLHFPGYTHTRVEREWSHRSAPATNFPNSFRPGVMASYLHYPGPTRCSE